jgi:hypothetical protein
MKSDERGWDNASACRSLSAMVARGHGLKEIDTECSTREFLRTTKNDTVRVTIRENGVSIEVKIGTEPARTPMSWSWSDPDWATHYAYELGCTLNAIGVVIR